MYVHCFHMHLLACSSCLFTDFALWTHFRLLRTIMFINCWVLYTVYLLPCSFHTLIDLHVHFHALPKSSLFLWSPSSLLVSILFYFCKMFISVVVFCKMFISVLCLSPIFFQTTRNQVHVPSRVKQTICSFINCIFLPMDAFCLDRTSNINLELTSFHLQYQTI